MRWIVVMLCLASGAALAQDAQDPKESLLHAELRREGERVSDACTFSFKAIPMCGYTLFYRPSAAHRGGQHAFAKRIRPGRRFRLDQEHKKLAAQLGRRRDRSNQRRRLARWWIHETDSYATSDQAGDRGRHSDARGETEGE